MGRQASRQRHQQQLRGKSVRGLSEFIEAPGNGQQQLDHRGGIAWWWDHSFITLGVYGANSSFPSATSPGPPDRGRNFFLGGTAAADLRQTLDLADVAGDIDDPGVDYELSGWFGGKDVQSDIAVLGVRFLNATNGLLGTNWIGGVTAAERNFATGLLERGTNGVVPAGTRRVEFVLAASSVSGNNDASADNLAFVLSARPDAPVEVVDYGFGDVAWIVWIESRTNRAYQLERSDTLLEWTAVSASVPGTGARLFLADPAPPATRGFYRVSSGKP